MDAPSPRDLVLDLLNAAAPSPVRVATLVDAARIFGHSENVLRVTLTRLRARAMVEAPGRGRYVVGPRAVGLSERVRAWRRPDDEALVPWDGETWWALAGDPADGPAATALRVLGLRALREGLAVRPANLAAGLVEVRRTLRRSGLDAPTFALFDLEPAVRARAERLWDVDALCRGHDALAARLDASLARLEATSGDDEDALRESFVLGGEAIRALVLDPDLPERLCPGGPRRRLRRVALRYDEQGRRLWSERLELPLDNDAPVGAMEMRSWA